MVAEEYNHEEEVNCSMPLSGELNTKLEDAYQELFNLRFQRATGQVDELGALRRGEEGYRPDQDDPAPARAGRAAKEDGDA